MINYNLIFFCRLEMRKQHDEAPSRILVTIVLVFITCHTPRLALNMVEFGNIWFEDQ